MLGGTILSVQELLKKIGDKISHELRIALHLADKQSVNPDTCVRGLMA